MPIANRYPLATHAKMLHGKASLDLRATTDQSSAIEMAVVGTNVPSASGNADDRAAPIQPPRGPDTSFKNVQPGERIGEGDNHVIPAHNTLTIAIHTATERIRCCTKANVIRTRLPS